MVAADSLLRIASRGSQLAMWQARSVRQWVEEANPGLRVEIQVIKTTGDKILDVPLARIGDRGLFTKELDEVLLAGDADIAVHSLKDVPTRLPEGLCLAAVTERADPRDVLLCRDGFGPALDDLPAGARVGTSSLRRRSQLLAMRPDLEVVDLRGNLNTRLAKLDAGDYEAILLAAAGVLRLGWGERISSFLDPHRWVPAVGQAALGIVARDDALSVHDCLRPLHHEPTAACVFAERTFLNAVEGGCQVPVGALAILDGGETLRLEALIAALDGRTVIRDAEDGDAGEAAAIGARLAERMLASGGKPLLDAIRRESGGIAPGVAAP
jgi:hydroxymethylbilane synthase